MDQEFRLRNTAFDCVMAAAGASSRMGEWKLLLPWGDSTVVDTAVSTALRCCSRVLLVVGYRGDELERMFAHEGRVVVVRNDAWERGHASSVKRGAALVRSERFFVALADMPLVSGSVYLETAAAAAMEPPDAEAGGTAAGADSRPRAFRPVHGGVPGHPVLFDARALSSVAALADEGSMKDVFKSVSLHTLDCADPGCVVDLDAPIDYRDARSRLPTRIVVVTGSRGSGKTRLCRSFAEAAAAAGRSVASATQIASGRGEDGVALGFDAELVARGLFRVVAGGLACGPADGRERFPLARKADESAAPPAPPAVAPPDELALGPFVFDRSAFDRVNRFVEAALRRGTEVLVLDEIGKLELDRGEGTATGLEAVLAAAETGRGPRDLYLSVRRDRAEAFAASVRRRVRAVSIIDLDEGKTTGFP